MPILEFDHQTFLLCAGIFMLLFSAGLFVLFRWMGPN
jgi:hypothetical protein